MKKFVFPEKPKYKFNVEIQIPESNDLFMPVIMYRDMLRQASSENTLGKGQEFSSLGVDQLINDLLIGGRIFNILDDKISEVSSIDSDVRSVISAKRLANYFVVDVKSADKHLVEYRKYFSKLFLNFFLILSPDHLSLFFHFVV